MGLKRKSSWVTLLALLLMSAPQLASAAPLTAPKEDSPLPDPEVAPRGRTAPRDIKYSRWRKLCFKAPGRDVLCRTTITGTWETGQMAIRLDVIEREGNPRIQILLPVGLYLQAGVKLRLGAKSRDIHLPYSWCFSNLCVAAVPLDKAAIAALGEAQTIVVEVVNTNLVALEATIPADQFSSAYKGSAAEIFEQVIDE